MVVEVVCVSKEASGLATALLAMALPPVRLVSFVGANSLAYLGLHRHFLLLLERHPLSGRYALKMPFLMTFAVLVALVPLVLLIDRYLPFMVGRQMRRAAKGQHSAQ